MQRVIPPWERVTPPASMSGGQSQPPFNPYAQQPASVPPSQPFGAAPASQPFGAAQPFSTAPASQQSNSGYGYPSPAQSGYGFPPQSESGGSLYGGASQFLQEATPWGSARESLALGAAAMMVGQSLGEPGSGVFPKMPGFAGYLSGIHGYLNVSQRYVGERLFQLVFPLVPSSRFGQGAASAEFGSSEAVLRLSAEPWKLPDLYVPLMALMTYVILYAVGRGGDFHPDVLYDTAAFASLLVAVEVALGRATAYLLGLASLGSFWESAAVAGYKFVHLSLILFFRLFFSGVLYYLAFAYLAAAAVFATFNFLRQPLKAVHGHGGPVGNYVIVAFAGLQVPLIWLLQR